MPTQPTTSQSMSASSTPSKRPQVRLVVPRSLAAEYTSAVRKAVATKSGDQKALELERCERLLQMYVRSYIAASPLPKVTFSPDEVLKLQHTFLLTSGFRGGEADAPPPPSGIWPPADAKGPLLYYFEQGRT